jgi:serine/threonine protein kinase
MADELDATQPPDMTQRSPSARVAQTDGLPALDAARYRVDEGPDAQLGRGGQGVVWRATDQVLRREVALKVLRPEVAQDAAVIAAFLREARLTAMLEHPGIVPLHDVGAGPDGTATLVLRRIVGQSLAEVLAGTKSLADRLRLVPAVLRACQAVAFAHTRGVVHRDLKPQNVMLGELGQTYVVDWGLARVEAGPLSAIFTEAVETPGVLGTPAYMSPEQALGLAADARSDV